MSSLPAIHQKQTSRVNVTTPGKSSASRRNQSPTASARAQRRQSRFMTVQAREMLKQEKIRKTQPTMDKVSTAQYRNTYFHNLCVGMLKDGFHRSFDEIFTLTEKRRKDREEAGPDSVLWEEIPLTEQFEKLDRLYVLLTKSEAALRNGKYEEVYHCRHNLAQFFLQENDMWLSDHFFDSSLEISLNIKLDGRRCEAEANCHVALALERKGEILKATEHMSKFHELTLGRTWKDDEDLNLHNLACRHLCRLHTSLANSEKVLETSRKSYHLALEFAKEGEDKLQEAQCSHKLGCAYETAHQSKTAIQYLEQSLRLAKDLNNDYLIGQACEALAKSHQTQGAIQRATEYLELFAITARNCDMKAEVIDACNCLGVIYNTMGQYDQAVNKFQDSYEISGKLNDDAIPEEGNVRPLMEDCAMQVGVALGNLMLDKFAGNMEIPERVMFERIAAWKDEGKNQFGDPLPTPVPPTPVSVGDPTPDPTEPFVEGEKMRQERLSSSNS